MSKQRKSVTFFNNALDESPVETIFPMEKENKNRITPGLTELIETNMNLRRKCKLENCSKWDPNPDRARKVAYIQTLIVTQSSKLFMDEVDSFFNNRYVMSRDPTAQITVGKRMMGLTTMVVSGSLELELRLSKANKCVVCCKSGQPNNICDGCHEDVELVREVIDSLGMNYRNLFVTNDYDENDYESDIESIDV